MQVSIRRLGVPRWLNARTVLGLVLFLTATIAGRAVMTASDERVTVLAAARPLASGTTLDASDFSPIEVALPSRQSGLYLASATDVKGAVLLRPLTEGQLVPVDAVAASAEPQRIVAIPIEPEHAAGGRLEPGDIVDVWATFDRGRNPITKLVVGSVEVVSLVEQGGLVGDEALSAVSIAIPPEAAPRVVLALRAGEIDILASDGWQTSDVTQSLEVGRL